MKQTIFRIVTSGVILRKRASSASRALLALLLAPKLLVPGKYQVTIVGILPNKCSQLARYCLVWGSHLVYGPAIVGQVTVKDYFTGCSPVHHLSVFLVFMFMYDMQVPN